LNILITGATGFIGHSLRKSLANHGYNDVVSLSSKDYNLLEQKEIRKLFKDHAPDVVFHLAAKVGGILANKTYPADFIYTNLAINTYFLEEARKAGVRRLIYTFCGCSYPKNAPNPIKEEYLFTGLPDENAMFYSLAKATNYLQILAYRRQHKVDWVAAVPGNAYGPYDNFSETGSHVIPALIRRFHFAKERGDKEVVVWGSGKPVRDFIYVEDVADGLVRMMEVYHGDSPVNISSGIGVSIKETAEIVKEVVGFEGKITWDKTKPDGHPVKIFDVSRMKKELNFEPKTKLKDGIKKTYEWFVNNRDKVRL
jgi:GDP-L-fucose synthase